MWRGILPCYHVEWRPYGSSAAREAVGENTALAHHTVAENLLDAELPPHSGGEGCGICGDAGQAKPHLEHNPLSLLAEYS